MAVVPCGSNARRPRIDKQKKAAHNLSLRWMLRTSELAVVQISKGKVMKAKESINALEIPVKIHKEGHP
jgi:hypothetical protein